MKKISLLLVICVFLLIPSLSFAQEEWGPRAGDWELILQGSGNSDDDLDNNNAAIEGSLAMFLTDGLELGLRQGASWFDIEDGDDGWDGSTRLFLDYNFHLNRLVPFIGVSAGYLYGDRTDERWIAGPEAGLKYYVQRSTFLFLLGEYNFTFEDSDEIDEAYEDGRFVYALGFGINW